MYSLDNNSGQKHLPFFKYLQSGLHSMVNTCIVPQALRMLNENLKEVTAVNKKALREGFVLSLILLYISN